MVVISTENMDRFVAELTAGEGVRPDRLLQHLYKIQYRYSCIPDQAIRQLGDALGLAPVQIQAVIDFYSFLHHSPRGDFDILFSDSITDHMDGSRELMHQLCAKLGVRPGEPRPDGRVTVAATSCTGMCDQGPAMLVNGLALIRLDSERVDRVAALVEAGTPLDGWPSEWFMVEDNIRRSDILLERNIAPGDALRALLREGPERLLQQLDDSDLRGRGGAGFMTPLKWEFCRKVPSDIRYVVCNADEGEPGTFKDRVLLQSYADEVIEGMTLGAGIIGGRQGFIYLRGEYRYLLEELEAVLQRRREQGLLGRDILGQPGFDFDIEIHMGAGAYICGEESALLDSLEGRRGIARKRPPFPVTAGYLGKPTVVNNVETLVAAAKIAVLGSEWFRSRGTGDSTGTKLLSVSGDCRYPGIYEYPMGVQIREILEDCGAVDPQAVQVAGAAGKTLPAIEFERCIACEDAATGGSFMVFNRQRDMLDMVRNFSHFFVHESCGFCTPCRVGGSLLKDLVDKVHAGHATEYDLQEMRRIGMTMQNTSHCGLGQTAPNAVLDTLDKFPESYQARLKSTEFVPAFDLDGALSEARSITGRDDAGAHLEEEV